MDFTAIDFETANKKRASACSIGMAKVRNGEIVDTFYSLLTPIIPGFDDINVFIHGIKEMDTNGFPTLIDLWPSISSFIGEDVLVGHNVLFEQSVINQSFVAKGLEIPKLEYLCTMIMTQINYPRRSNYKLPSVYKDIFGLEINHHNALEDAKACGQLCVHHISKFNQKDPKRLVTVIHDTPISKTKKWQKTDGPKFFREEMDSSHPFFDQNIVITGVFQRGSRENAVVELLKCGAKYQNGVNSKTNYLVVGDQEMQLITYGKESSKSRRVKELNGEGKDIKIISENDFWDLIAYNGSKK